MSARPVIVVLGPSGLETARRIATVMEGVEIHGPKDRVPEADTIYDSAVAHIADLFREGRPVIGICASGILIRAVAPELAGKHGEPPVIAVSETGEAAVPLLGGHRGGNELARRIAQMLGIVPAITTAGDARFGVALDDPPQGWTLANPQHAKDVMATLLAGAKVRLTGKAGWLEQSLLPLAADSEIELLVTESAIEGSPKRLVYNPKTLGVGVGCERGCDPEELIALVDGVLSGQGLAPASIALVASLDLKADEEAVHTLARRFGVPARFFSAERLNAEAPRLRNPSEAVLREVGCPGVAEGAALAATGPDGKLLVEKTKSKRATCAIASAPGPIDPETVGRGRGRLAVVGIGPGGTAWRSPEATELLRKASDWIGYGLYLDLASDLYRGKTVHRYELGDETARARHALELAGEGRDAALVCSGDAGIYAMASLVYELVDRDETLSDAARRAEITIAPGISALQAAAARAGAPLGHDFCAISLSDLLTPWKVIEKRLRAAAEGDFVVALYNPKSARRMEQIVRAMDILAAHRPPETPVIVASKLGREGEKVRIAMLGRFDPETVDMLTVVIVGSSTTRLIGAQGEKRVYTPRGYAAKGRTQ